MAPRNRHSKIVSVRKDEYVKNNLGNENDSGEEGEESTTNEGEAEQNDEFNLDEVLRLGGTRVSFASVVMLVRYQHCYIMS